MLNDVNLWKQVGFKTIKVGGDEFLLQLVERLLLALLRAKCKSSYEPFEVSMETLGSALAVDRTTIMRSMSNLDSCGLIYREKVKRFNYSTWSYIGVAAYTGVSDIYGTIAVPEILLADIPTTVKACSGGNTHYVYICKKDGVPIYVGKGKGNRINHCLSGNSSSAELNKIFYSCNGDGMTVDKVIEGVPNSEAMIQEQQLINKLLADGHPLVNKQIWNPANMKSVSD